MQARRRQQALLVLAHLKKGETFAAQLAAGFGAGTATARRYVNEALDLLAAAQFKAASAGGRWIWDLAAIW